MPSLNDMNAPDPKAGSFSRLSRQTQALLLALLMFAVGAGAFLLGMHGMRAGEPLTSMAGRSDWSDSFLVSAGAFVLGACLLAVALGWKPGGSSTQPPE